MEKSHDLLSNELQLNNVTESHLTETAKWGKFLAIMGFIFCGVMIIVAFVAGSYISNMNTYSSVSSTGISATVTVVYLLFALITFFPCLFLYKFSVKMQQALKTTNQEDFESSFQNLKSMFKFQGVLAIIFVAIWILSILALLAKGF